MHTGVTGIKDWIYLVDFLLFPLHQALSEKASTLKGKKIAPKGTVDPFSEGRQKNFDKVSSTPLRKHAYSNI